MKRPIFIIGRSPKIAQELEETIALCVDGVQTYDVFSDLTDALSCLPQRTPCLIFVSCGDFINHPDLEVLSGFRQVVLFSDNVDFRLAKRIVHLRIAALIRYPFEPDELRGVIDGAQEAGECRSGQESGFAEIVNKLTELQEIFPRNMIYRMSTYSDAAPDAVLSRWNMMETGYSLQSFFHCAIEASLQGTSKNADLWKKNFFHIRDIINHALRTYHSGLCFNGGDENSLGILFCVKEGGVLSKELVLQTLSEIERQVELTVHLKLAIGVGQMHELVEEMPLSYKEARIALSYQCQLRGMQPIFFDEIFLPDMLPSSRLRQIFKFNELLEMGRYSDARSQLCSIFSSLSHNGERLSAAHSVCLDIGGILRANAIQNGIDDSGEYQNFLQSLADQTSVRGFQDQADRLLSNYEMQIIALRQKAVFSIVDRAKSIIQTNYHTDLSLTTVAAQLYINPSYLSQLFHKETGQKFVDYLVSVRIENAKVLLADPTLKVYEVGEMVGYPNKRYFSKLFERYTHMSPSKYRSHITMMPH